MASRNRIAPGTRPGTAYGLPLVALFAGLLGLLLVWPRAGGAGPDAPSDSPPGKIEFEASNLFSTANGVFHDWRIVASQVDPADLSRAWAEVEVDLSSVDTGIDRRDDHLRKPDFFGVETHPVARVRVDSARPDGRDEQGRPRYAARFAIDLHGVKKALAGEIVVIGQAPLVLEGRLELDRTEFAVGPPPSRWNPMSVRAEVPIRFEVRP